jgi:hypothetical protein
MYIRKTFHTHTKTGAKDYTHILVESIRTEKGPRQRVLLNLGVELPIPEEEWKELAHRIEEIIAKQMPLLPVPDHIEVLAQKYAGEVIRHLGNSSESDKLHSKAEEPEKY